MRTITTMSAFAASAMLLHQQAAGAEFDARAAHKPFMQAFNTRDWGAVRSVLVDDAVFHRANAEEVYLGPDSIIGRFSDTIGNPKEWNVKFVRLDSDGEIPGKDGRVVERGDFAITAGGDDSVCYGGSYMATWAPSDGGWKLQVLSWQDVETHMETCQ